MLSLGGGERPTPANNGSGPNFAEHRQRNDAVADCSREVGNLPDIFQGSPHEEGSHGESTRGGDKERPASSENHDYEENREEEEDEEEVGSPTTSPVASARPETGRTERVTRQGGSVREGAETGRLEGGPSPSRVKGRD